MAEAERAIATADWERADALLTDLARLDRDGTIELLGLGRKLEDGRGTRRGQLARVTAFAQRFPHLAEDPRVRVERGLALRAHGEMIAAREEFLAARDALGDAGDARTRAAAEAGIGLTYLSPLDATRARRALETSRAIAEEAGNLDQVSYADLYLAYVEIDVGDVDRAARWYRRALEGYERLGDEAGIRHAAYNLGMCLNDLGRDRAARRYVQRSLDLARKRNEHWYAAFASLILGELDRKAGKADGALARYDDAEALFRRLSGPNPTEKAWIDMRRAEVHLARGDLKTARRLARSGLDPRVEPTPQLYARLQLAVVRARTRRDASTARLVEKIAIDAEAMALNEIAWRARGLAASIRLELAVERRLDGEAPDRNDPDVDAVRGHVRRAISTLEGTMGAMRPRGRAAFLRDLARSEEARALLTLDTIAAQASAGDLLSPTLGARAAWLALLGSIGAIASASSPLEVVKMSADAIVELARARRGFLWFDPSAEGEALHAGRDLDRRDQQPRKRPSEIRPRRVGTGMTTLRVVQHARQAVGLLLLEEPVDGPSFDPEVLELVDALSTVAAVLVEAARTRARLVSRAEAQEASAAELAAELARKEVALGEARRTLEERGRAELPTERAGIVGRSGPMREVFTRLDRLRGTELPVLITGESGTGKELVARAIHEESARASGPFVAVNCGALAEGLLESELFGHVRGAFTGATRDAPGLFVVANGGTLLLDEIGEMSLPMQAKLLRVLQEGEVRPVGAARSRKVDVRVIAATHRDLEEMVHTRSFREDLFYRLHVLTVHVPPLRARGDDVVLLARKFLERAAKGKRLGPDAAAWLVAQPWPGNVRELRAVIEAAAVLVEGDVLHARDLAPPPRKGHSRNTAHLPRIPERLDDLEAWAIARALERHGGSRAKVARALGIGRATLYRKLATYGLEDRPDDGAGPAMRGTSIR
jgi:DNA-binding NtrC family response regulator